MWIRRLPKVDMEVFIGTQLDGSNRKGMMLISGWSNIILIGLLRPLVLGPQTLKLLLAYKFILIQSNCTLLV